VVIKILDVVLGLHVQDMAHGSLDLDCIQLQWDNEDDSTAQPVFTVQVRHHERMYIQALLHNDDHDWMPSFNEEDLYARQLQDFHDIAIMTHFLLTASSDLQGNFSSALATNFISSLLAMTTETVASQRSLTNTTLHPWLTTI